ncbi:STAS domain-containing protein [Oscillochloris sp. ZM17-4]|uniref:STAS domain-containing protein n=1 Tax=Oscillochloris sp. ZM17-4 TaxID=2866714 RepID=UPI001C735E07|nr:STAS domain-containing protein [Oscillochloris sp. ZM17-4]MBX0329728.1 STAS domain-containing protein [Oscillochloris sp. ZM17-4]
MQAPPPLSHLFTMRHPDEDLQRRGQNLVIVLWGLVALELLSLPVSLVNGRIGSAVNAIFAAFLGLMLIVLTKQGRVNLVSLIMVLATTASLVLVLVLRSAQFSSIAYYFIINLLVAGLVMRPWAIWATLGLSLVALALGAGLVWNVPDEVPSTFVIALNAGLLIGFAALIAFLSSVTTTRALHEARESREEVQRSNLALSENLTSLELQATRLHETERMLRSLVDDLETPTVALSDGVLLAPIIGQVDESRAKLLLGRLLSAASAGHARLMVIDIAGVRTVDAQVSSSLLQTAQALRLIGCSVAITGISSEVANSLANLDVRLDEIITARSPQDVLAIAEPGARAMDAARRRQRSGYL